MHRTGHTGVTLAVYAPVAYVLVSDGQVTLALLGLIGMVVIEPLPDRDMEIPWLTHRGASHTLLGALVIGLLAAATVVIMSQIAPVYLELSVDTSAVAALDSVTLTLFAFAIGFLAVVAHLLGDVLTPMGIRPFWPVSARRFSLNLWTASNPLANPLLFVLGVSVLASAMWFSFDLIVPSGTTVKSLLREMFQVVMR